MRLVLDTNIYCDFAEGRPHAVEAIATYGEFIFIPSTVLGELSYGFLKGTQKESNERKLRQVISRLNIEIINVDEDVAGKYAIIYSSLVRKGRKIPINDVWIAASCMKVGGVLITRDKHFEAIDQIDSIVMD